MTEPAEAPDSNSPALGDLLPHPGETLAGDELFERFEEWATGTGLSLYPAQTAALLELAVGNNVILATPTGSGKSLVAMGAHFLAVAQGQRTFYTAPIKALVSEKFFALCEVFGAERVGMMTGDASVNADAPIICCTAEVLANLALRQGKNTPLGQVVMDEFHFYAEPDRGWAWQVPLLELPQAQFLLMSATLGDTTRFETSLKRRTGRDTVLVAHAERPVPLHFSYAITAVHDTIAELLSTSQAPIYVVHFTQAAALERAQALMSNPIASREQKDAIAEALGGFRFSAGFGKVLSRLIRHGVGVHHAGMLPKYRRLVEQLAQQGLLKVVCGTDTLGVGINVPIRTVLMTGLTKFDGVRQRQLKVREFLQVAGRAGRAGFDTAGTVIVQAPDHEVENERLLARAGDDEKKRKRIVRKKPPEGQVTWGRKSFERLVEGEPEALTSHLQVTHATVLNLLARDEDPVAALERLIDECDENDTGKERLRTRGEEIFESLRSTGIVEETSTSSGEKRLALTVELPLHFALNQPLSPFALAALEVLDAESPTYALDVLSVYESTLEDPRAVISAQVFKAKGEAVAQMKADGIEYDERMELLEEITHPKPLLEELNTAYEIYASGHPWVRDHELKPKSVVRDMYERAMSFGEYVAYYNLTRSEGLVLRYLADAYRVLRQSVPESARSEELTDLTNWLGELVRQVDSSLLDEWESLLAPHQSDGADPLLARPSRESVLSDNPRALRVLVRNAMFLRVRLAAMEDYDALEALDAEAGWDGDAWADAMDEYFEEYDDLDYSSEARGPQFFAIDEKPEGTEPGQRIWQVRQTFCDPEKNYDWGITAQVDLNATDESGELALRVVDVHPL